MPWIALHLLYTFVPDSMTRRPFSTVARTPALADKQTLDHYGYKFHRLSKNEKWPPNLEAIC